MRKGKPFPSKINWMAFWKHRYLILDFINQVAHGSASKADIACGFYGGSPTWAKQFKAAADEIITVVK